MRRGDAKWPADSRVGTGLYRLDFRSWGIRITLGWRRDVEGRRNPLVDEAWRLDGADRAAAEAWRAARVMALRARRGTVEVLTPEGRVLGRVAASPEPGDGPRHHLTPEGRSRRLRALPPPRELFEEAGRPPLDLFE